MSVVAGGCPLEALCGAVGVVAGVGSLVWVPMGFGRGLAIQGKRCIMEKGSLGSAGAEQWWFKGEFPHCVEQVKPVFVTCPLGASLTSPFR